MIRKALPSDAQAITDILRSIGWFEQVNSTADDILNERIGKNVDLSHSDQSHSIYVAEEDGNVVGYAAVHWLPYLFFAGAEGYVSELFIHETARGKGIGTQLLAAVKEEAGERGCARLMLINSRDRESYMRKFYEKQGWKERAEMANFVYVLK